MRLGDPPSPPRRRRIVLLVVACVAIAALVSLLVVALRGSGRPSTDTARPAGAPLTLDPAQRLPTEAAVRNGWTMIAHDEFDGDALDDDHWSPYKGKTTDDVGRNDPDNISVSDGTLKIISQGNTSAGLEWNDGQLYGRWEARVRSRKGNGYGPVLLLWPDAEDWPEGGEIDIMEIPKGDRTTAHFTVHWGDENTQDGTSVQADFTQWHTFAVEWTPDHVIGYLDGNQIYRNDDSDANPPRSMHFAMQQDIGPYGDDWIPARDASTPDTCTFEVDWVRIYAP
jgi:beta-glucanase (GH16 family)